MHFAAGFRNVQSMVCDALKIPDCVQQLLRFAVIGLREALCGKFNEIGADAILVNVDLFFRFGNALRGFCVIIPNERKRVAEHGNAAIGHVLGQCTTAVNRKAGGGHEPFIQQYGLLVSSRIAFDGEAGEAFELAHKWQHYNNADEVER